MVDKSLKEWMWQVTSSGGGGGGDHEELTQAEYDALTDAEKTNGTVYFITDGVPSIGADYIVEQGTSGIWTYRKWNSGILECWGHHTQTLSIPASGTGHLTLPLFPISFVDNATITCSGGGTSNANIAVGYVNAGYSNPDVWMRNFSGPAFNSTVWANIHAVGKWK